MGCCNGNKALAECRDAFDVPEPGSKLEDAWVAAMQDPSNVPEYVKACREDLIRQVENSEAEAKKLAEAFQAQQVELKKLKDANEVTSYGRH